MREIRSSGIVGERGGNEPLYPEDLFFPSILSGAKNLFRRNSTFGPICGNMPSAGF
jgi:hypothetical protein